MARRAPTPPPLPESGPRAGDADLLFPGLAEALRRAALGLVALLFVARAFYPSEDAEAGSGLVWLFALLGTAALAVAANLLGGVVRYRRSWVDALVLTLILLVAWSAGHAADRRSAITMAWEWGGFGLLYFMARNLPRGRGESAALVGVVVATAVAVAAYGLFQVGVEFAQLRALYTRNPARLLAQVGVAPGTPSAESFQKRLMDSNEPFSTFALANSLAGFLVGPLVVLFAVGLENLRDDRRASKLASLALASLPTLLLLVCLLLTKSRSAYVGLAIATGLLAWRYRSVVPRRWLVGAGVGLGVMLGGLVAAGVATRQLDLQILTEARKSLGYRWEYWAGSWGVITDAPAPFAPAAGADGLLGGGTGDSAGRSGRAFWWGVGPANFAGPYLRHKLPEASEEIQDPHNMIMEVWAESGVFAMLALVASLGIGVVQVLAPAPAPAPAEPAAKDKVRDDELAVGAGSDDWIAWAGGLGWFGVWALGQLNPVTQGDMLARWLTLGVAWGLTALLIRPIWSRRPIPAAGVGLAVVALAVNLLAAGGIGIPAVAMSLWVALALGLNLRDDRPCGTPRVSAGLGLGVALACGWAVAAGTFVGAVGPGWRADIALAEAEAAMAAKPPRFEVARNALADAIAADRYAVRPWLALADLEYQFWRSPETQDKSKTTWTRVLLTFDKALEGTYRDPDNLAIRRRQASYARLILGELPADAKPFELLGLRSTIAKAARQSVRLYPTSATLRAELAQASADLGLYRDAAAEARVALQLDGLTPHADKKLPAKLRTYLKARLIEWDEQAKAPAPTPLKK